MFRDIVRIAIGVGLICGLASVAAPAQNFTVLHSFTGTDGGVPFGGVAVDHAGNVYGTTYLFGPSSAGTVFKIDPQGKETIVHAFGSIPNDGYEANATFVEDAAGNFYGTTGNGGAYGQGTVFKINSSGEYRVLYSFKNSDGDAQNPSSGLILHEGILYGTSAAGGSFGKGTIFQIDEDGEERVLYSFRGTADGSGPCGTLLRTRSGALYGTASGGGAHGFGTVFKLNDDLEEKTLFSFTGGTAGQNSCSGLVRDAAGNLYGTTPPVPVPPQIGAPPPPPIPGTLFKIARNGAHTVVHIFAGPPDGADPQSGLVADKAGNFYGTTVAGGAHNAGSIYKLEKSGKVTILYSLGTAGADGAGPVAGVTLGTDGNFYGTTIGGGSQGWGTVFKFTP